MAFFAFLQLDGIKGTCTEEVHKDWIAVDEFHYSLKHTLAGDMHSQGAITGGIVSQGDLVINKQFDAASPLLALHCCESRNIKKGILEVSRMINAKKEIYIRYTMDNIAVTSVMPGGKANGPSDVPAEIVTLRPSVIRWEYLPTSQEKTGAAIKHGWNFPEQRKQDT